MKKILVVWMAALLLLCVSCTKKSETETQPKGSAIETAAQGGQRGSDAASGENRGADTAGSGAASENDAASRSEGTETSDEAREEDTELDGLDVVDEYVVEVTGELSVGGN